MKWWEEVTVRDKPDLRPTRFVDVIRSEVGWWGPSFFEDPVGCYLKVSRVMRAVKKVEAYEQDLHMMSLIARFGPRPGPKVFNFDPYPSFEDQQRAIEWMQKWYRDFVVACGIPPEYIFGKEPAREQTQPNPQ